MKLQELLDRNDLPEDVKKIIENNITELSDYKESINADMQRFQMILKYGPAVLYACKAYGDFGATFISENVKNQMGYRVNQFIDDSGFWVNNIHPDERARVLDELKYLFENNHYIHEYRFLHADGKYVWMRDEIILMRDNDGNPKEIIGYWVDITDRKDAEKKNVELAAAAVEMKKAQELQALNQQLRASEEQLKAANNQLKAKEQALLNKMADMEMFNKLMVGRELDMVALKKEVNSLLKELGRSVKFDEV